MNKKWVEGGDLSWRFPPEYDHSDILSARPAPTGTEDPDEP